ncbi:MAG: 16S rRNA (adenine(1518)-N(6)/adenine(1519)-N(6))-dimethyltransferase RsmA [Coriobacteriaceae bacterium]|nr:16S rRNA (adenine(1518)-N(6)/adenine(1519)-N(6))-dimethyltransferase RsmA [Coriobacteriaceae bacterium]
MSGTPPSPLANPKATRDVLERFDLTSKYALGQNFLVDDNVVGRILDLAGLAGSDDSEACVLEVGAGIGTLTVALLDHASVIAVECDHDLAAPLSETTAAHSERLALIEKDAVKLTRDDVDRAARICRLPQPGQLVANLPYAVAATVVLAYLQRFDFLDSLTVMVQAEVADRMRARPSTKDYGAYTVKLQLYAHVGDSFAVAPSCFYPAPHVDSTVIRLEHAPLVDDPETLERAADLADAAFAQRRKTVRNSMQTRYPAQTVDELLAACGIDPGVRGETLEAQDFLALAQAYRRIEPQL